MARHSNAQTPTQNRIARRDCRAERSRSQPGKEVRKEYYSRAPAKRNSREREEEGRHERGRGEKGVAGACVAICNS